MEKLTYVIGSIVMVLLWLIVIGLVIWFDHLQCLGHRLRKKSASKTRDGGGTTSCITTSEDG